MVSKYIPKQGDIIYLDFNPTKGHEQKGARTALAISNNVSFLCLCCFGNLSHKFSLFLSIPYYIRQKSCKKAFFLTKNKLLFRREGGIGSVPIRECR